MLKKKRVISSKSNKKIVHPFNLKIMALCVLGATILVAGLLYKSMVQKSTINLLESGQETVCTTVSSITYSNSCIEGSYQNISFTCGTSNTINNLGGTSSCKQFTTWYQEAKTACQQSCPVSTPAPYDQTYRYDLNETGLISYWPMDEVTNNSCSGGVNDACDKKGSSDGSAVGTQIVAGKFAKARSLNGTSDYINLPPRTNHFGSFTYEAWINPSGTVKSDGVILCEGDSSGGCYQKFFLSASNGKLTASIDAVGTNHYSNKSIQPNVWTHVAMTYDGVARKLTLYVNGQPQTDIGTLTPKISGSSIRIGARTTSAPGLFFAGLIDEVRIYSVALSADTIFEHFRAPNATPKPDGTTAPQPTTTAVPYPTSVPVPSN